MPRILLPVAAAVQQALGVIPRRVPWTRQPPAGTRIDWSNPLTRGLKYAITYGGGYPEDAVGNARNITLNGDGAITGTSRDARGYNQTGHAYADRLQVATNAEDVLDYSAGFSVFHKCRFTGGTSVNEFGLSGGGSDDAADWYTLNGSVNTVLDDKEVHTVSLTVPAYDSGDNAEIRLDHESMAVAAVSNLGTSVPYGYILRYDSTQDRLESYGQRGSTDNPLNIGSHNPNRTSDGWEGDIYLSLIWQRVLSPEELKSLNENPWQIFQPQTRFLPVAGAGAAAVQQALGVIPRRVPWTRQPPVGTQLDRSKPLTKGLRMLAVPASDARLLQIENRWTPSSAFEPDRSRFIPPPSTGSPVSGVDQHGRYVAMTANEGTNSDGWDWGYAPDELSGSADRTVAVLHTVDSDSTSDERALFGMGVNSTSDRWTMRYAGGDLRLEIEGTGNTESVAITAGDFGVTAAVQNGSTLGDAFLYYHGTELPITNATGVTTLTGSLSEFQVFGTDRTASTDNCLDRLYWFAVWDRALSVSELHSLNENPWQIFQPQTRFLPVGAPAAAGGTGQNVNVGQATETDLAQPLTADFTVPTGLATETDVAQPLTVDTAVDIAVGQAIETDLAQPLSINMTVPLGLATETDLAQPLSIDTAVDVAIGQAVEVDAAQPLTGSFTVPVGQASETDLAQPIDPNQGIVVNVGQAVETDIAQPLTGSFTVPVGQAVETDIAQPITAQQGILIAVGQAVETDTAQPLSIDMAVPLGLASETDTAQPITVSALNKTATVSSIVNGQNLTNLSYTVFDGYDISTAPILKQGSGESTNGSGDLVVDLNDTAVSDGDPLSIVITDYTTTPTVSNSAAVCYTTAVVA